MGTLVRASMSLDGYPMQQISNALVLGHPDALELMEKLRFV
jgi:hypothetical protein